MSALFEFQQSAFVVNSSPIDVTLTLANLGGARCCYVGWHEEQVWAFSPHPLRDFESCRIPSLDVEFSGRPVSVVAWFKLVEKDSCVSPRAIIRPSE